MPIETSMESIQQNRKALFSINKIYLFIFQILIFLMLFMPRNIQGIKLIMIIILFVLGVIQIFKCGKIKLNRNVLVYLGIFLCYGLLTSFIGFWRLNPGVLGFFRVNVIYFILLAILIEPIRDIQTFEKILKVIIIASNVIAIYSILLLLVHIGIWPDSLFIVFDVTSNVGLHQGYTHLTNTNLSMMIFLAPMVTMLLGENYSSKNITRKYLFFSEVLIIIAVLISGRRILWISLGIPILILFFSNISKISLRKLSVVGLSILLVMIVVSLMNKYVSISFDGLISRFLSAFEGGEENVRFFQAKALWRGFLEYPLFGSGAGIGLSDYIRSSNNPWAYELSYNSILYHSGLVGFSIYLISMVYLLLSLWKRTKLGFSTKIAKAMLITFFIVLIGNATNPYFSSSFDFLLFIFIPLMYINIRYLYN